MAFHWTCPFCSRDTTITDTAITATAYYDLRSADGYRSTNTTIIVCPNPKCAKTTLTLALFSVQRLEGPRGPIWESPELLHIWSLIPPSSAKVFADYVPEPIRDDYTEACMIRDLSPKASATLSRRCLQGMIRDFWGITKARLVDEIEAIKDKVDAHTWAAIDAVRSVGNIGAHMEKDINVIVDVEPQEAQLLIGMIEMLIKDWYVMRQERKERLAAIVQVKDAKNAAKVAAPKQP